MEEETSLAASGITRRDIIKAGAVVGGAVWVAPVIDSFVSRAAAGSVPPGSGPPGTCTGCVILNPSTAPPTCGDSIFCSCVTAVDDSCQCIAFTVVGSTCTSNADCGAGNFCVRVAGSSNTCATPC